MNILKEVTSIRLKQAIRGKTIALLFFLKRSVQLYETCNLFGGVPGAGHLEVFLSEVFYISF